MITGANVEIPVRISSCSVQINAIEFTINDEEKLVTLRKVGKVRDVLVAVGALSQWKVVDFQASVA